MKKLLFLLMASGMLVNFAHAQSRKIRILQDSGSFISETQMTTTDTTTPHRSFYKRTKGNYQVYVYGQNVYVIDQSGKTLYSFNLKSAASGGDSVTKGSGAGFAGYHGDGGVADLGAYLEAMLRVSYLNYSSIVTTAATIKTGRGVLHSICIDSAGVGGKGVCTIWDAANWSDTLLTATPRLFSGSITAVGERLKDVKYEKGIKIKQKTTIAGELSISYYFIDPELFDIDSYGEPSN